MRTRSLGTLYLIISTFLYHGCSEDSDDFPSRKRCASTTSNLASTDGGFTPENATSRGLLLSTTENYKSSRLFFFDFATGKKTQLLSGESGDPGVFTSRGETFFINRSADNSNLRSLTVGANDFAIGVQTAIPGAGTGDPQNIVHIDENHLLMSFWASSKLGVFDLEECEMVKTFEFSVDLAGKANSVFRPSSFVQVGSDQNQKTYVIHQGISSDGFSLNGTQQIFGVTWDGTELELDDDDAEKDLIQGIPLKVSNPTAAFLNADSSLNVVGSCTIFNTADCVHGIETVNLAEKSTVLSFDFSVAKEKNNGSVVAASEITYYMQMIVPGTAGDLSDSKKIVAQINLQDKTITETYAYPSASSGCCGLFYESSAKKLIVTDYTPTGGGEVFFIDENKKISSKVSIENTPYSGIIVSN
jgi:hypothetical protein